MGADFLLVAVPTPFRTENEFFAGSRDYRQKLLDEIELLPTNHLRLPDVAEWDCLEDELSEDECAEWEERGEMTEALAILVRNRLTDAVKGVLDDDGDLFRDTTLRELGGRVYLFAGGMSWGDAPADAFGHLEVLAIAGLFPESFPDPVDSEVTPG